MGRSVTGNSSLGWRSLTVACVLLMCVCFAHPLKNNSTLANLKRGIQLLESRANSMMRTYEAQRHAVATAVAQNERLADAAGKRVPELAEKQARHSETESERYAELASRMRREFGDMAAAWDDIQRAMQRAQDLVRVLEGLDKEL
ncbi:hypothetical protein NHX12_014213 [Muraenolepis orangiensis]|uniref:Uncharacterized protein n=1 Tax=Muraenolepis orangiensis TaxID=630683 RepID=A0A9Q0DBQ6_9TELE|nr:hypothetical protein NHX12_014213 [Muraenolepis orangiensis]